MSGKFFSNLTFCANEDILCIIKNELTKRCFVLLNCDQAAAMRIDEDVLAFHSKVCRIAGGVRLEGADMERQNIFTAQQIQRNAMAYSPHSLLPLIFHIFYKYQ